MKVAIIDGNTAYKLLFTSFGYEVVLSIEDADLACFTGGEDVTPSLYGAKKHHYTHNSEIRDAREIEAFNICKERGIPMVGICRGAQFLNVMSGGSMYQHVEKHTQDHQIIDIQTSEVLLVSSTHHQMMKPKGNAIIIAVANEEGIREWYEKDAFFAEVSDSDYEVVYYEDTKCLCFQPHPEFSGERYEPMKKYFHNLVKSLIFEEESK